MMEAAPVPPVAAWMARHPSHSLFTASICQAEILSGVAIMPPGRRRAALESAARAMFAEDFAGRILPFDDHSAACHAGIVAARKQAGRQAATLDVMIAAVAQANDASIVTRNVADFAGFGLTIISPWSSAA